MLPFSRDEFFAVFASYNTTVWPAQVLLYALALGLVALALRGRHPGSRAVSVGLGLLWIWTGVVYHWWQFTAVNRLAWAFGALFVIQGGLFVAQGAGRSARAPLGSRDYDDARIHGHHPGRSLPRREIPR